MRSFSKTTLIATLIFSGVHFATTAWSQDDTETREPAAEAPAADAPATEVAAPTVDTAKVGDMVQIDFSDYKVTYEEMAMQYLKRELKNPPQYFEINWAQMDPETLKEAQGDEFKYKEKEKEKIKEYLDNQKVLGSKITFAITGKFMAYDFKKKAFLVDDFFDTGGDFRVEGMNVPTFPAWNVKGKNELPKYFNLAPSKKFTHIPMDEAAAKALTSEMAQSNRSVTAIFETEIVGSDKKMLKGLSIMKWVLKVNKMKLYRWESEGHRYIGDAKL